MQNQITVAWLGVTKALRFAAIYLDNQMEDEKVELSNAKKRKQGRIRCIGVIVAIIVVFIVGFLIGYFARKVKSDHDDKENRKERGNWKERVAQFHKQFQDGVDTEQLENSLRNFSEKPHIAGYPRQLELAKELEKRWKDYGFDKVELPEYKVLLSFPQEDNPNSVTLFNGSTEVYNISGKEKIVDPSEDDPDVVPPFLGYAPNGTVKTNQLVYVNYGRVEDFGRLQTLSVDVKDRIAIMRYGKIYRGDKIANAARYGAIGALLYSDPADYAKEGYGPKNTYPNTPWLPETGAQRGSLYNGPGGDPQTPGLPSLDGMYRRPRNESHLPPIPAHPMSYGDALHFLRAMGGNEVPSDWKGTLNITYRLGPNFTHKDVAVELVINNKLEVKSIFNVVGTIYGKEEPDRYVLMGNHRDSWVFGAVDASSGTTTTTEVARGLGELLKEGWRPRRTIKICSWGGEEFGLLGSAEWVEEHAKILSERAVIYLNFDISVGGNFVMRSASSPLLKDDIWRQSKMINDPNAHDSKETIYDIMMERNPSETDPGKPNIGTLGSGSDYASFYQYIGVPSADFSYYFGHNNKSLFYPVYHSQHDTFKWMKKFVDPEFKFHKTMTQLAGSLLLNYADSPLLSMSASRYAYMLNRSFTSLNANENLKGRDDISLAVLKEAIKKFDDAATKFDSARSKMSKILDGDKRPDDDQNDSAKLRRFNDQMIQLERAFIYPYGLPGRRLVRHVIFAPSQFNLYGSSSFPGVSDVLFNVKETGEWEEVKRQISIATQAVLSAVDVLALYDSK